MAGRVRVSSPKPLQGAREGALGPDPSSPKLGLTGESQPPGEIVAMGSRAGAEGTTWRGGDVGRG